MLVTSINQTLADENPDAIRVEGSFIILTYGLTEVYHNDHGREVFRALNPDAGRLVTVTDPKPMSRWSRFWHWLTFIQLSPQEQEEIKQWAKYSK